MIPIYFDSDPYVNLPDYKLKEESIDSNIYKILTYEKQHSTKWQFITALKAIVYSLLGFFCQASKKEASRLLWDQVFTGKEIKVIKLPLPKDFTSRIPSEGLKAPNEPKLTPLDIPLKTEIFKTDDQGKKILVKPTVYSQECNDEKSHCYRIKLDGEQMQLGDMTLYFEKDHIYIHRMQAWRRDEFQNIGRMMHELALKISHQQGHERRIKLEAAYGSDGFHFKCGFRYDQPYMFTLDLEDRSPNGIDGIADEVRSLVINYSSNKQAGRSNEETVTKITDIKYQKYLKILENYAEKELRRKPADIDEIIEYGSFINFNVILNRVYNHSSEKRDLPIYHQDRFSRGGRMTLIKDTP